MPLTTAEWIRPTMTQLTVILNIKTSQTDDDASKHTDTDVRKWLDLKLGHFMVFVSCRTGHLHAFFHHRNYSG